MVGPSKRQQRGLSLVSLIIVAVLIGVVVIFAAKTVPAVSEWRSIDTAVKKAANSETTAKGAMDSFERAAAVDNITSLKGVDLDIAKNGDQLTIKYAYEKRFEIFGPAYLLLDFKGEHRTGQSK